VVGLLVPFEGDHRIGGLRVFGILGKVTTEIAYQ